MSDAYSALKVLHHPARLGAYKEGQPFAPAHVQIILSDWCNQSCSFCAYRMEGYTSNALFGVETDKGRNNNPRRQIETNKVIEILDACEAMGVRAIQYTGGGEPCAHKDHHQLFGAVLDRGMELALVSNGTLLTKETIDLLGSCAAWVRISLDAGNEDTYNAVRHVPKAQFGKALATIGHLASAKRKSGSPMVLGVGFVVTPDNWTDVIEATMKAKALGADNIRISAMFSQEDEQPYLLFYKQARDLIDQAKECATADFQVIDRFGDRLDDLRLKSPDYERCGYQHFTTYIGGDLNVYRCCNTAYNLHGLLGSIAERRFDEFWRSEETQRALYEFHAPSCSRCQFNAINRVISYGAEQDPLHADFV